MPHTRRLAALLAAAAPLAAPLARPLAAQTADRVTLRGRDVAVYDPAGRVRLVAGDGADVTVEVTRGGRDAARLRVQTADDGRALVVVPPDGADLVYPALGRWSRTTVRLRRDGTFDDRGGGGGMFSRDGLTVRGTGDGTEAWADLVVSVPRGARVAVHVGAGAAEASNVDGDLTFRLQAAEARTERTRGRLLVDAGSGAVRVRDAEGDAVTLDTGSGAVEVQGVRAGRLRIDTGSGSARGADVTADRLEFDAGSGSARFERVRARTVRLDTGSGSVDVELLDDVDELRADTGSGGVTLRVPATLGAALDVDTGSGSIQVDGPVTDVTRRERDHLTGRLGDGRGRVVIDTGSGGVRLLRGR